MKIPRLTETQKEHFWSNVRKGSQEQCWPWMAAQDRDGYGVIQFNGYQYRAHIIAFFLAIEIWPSGRLIMHRCDNPSCCNSIHLSDGTHLDNNRDSIAKGRSRLGCSGHIQSGNIYVTLLTEEDIREIRRFGLLMRAPDIAKMSQFRDKVSQSTVYQILNREAWKDIK